MMGLPLQRTGSAVGLLGDTPARDYSDKLQLFNAFAEPEIRRSISTLRLVPSMRVLDAGCGTGEALRWLHEAVSPTGSVIGLELSTAHAEIARAGRSGQVAVFQGDLLDPPFARASFDLVWSVNTINHLHDPLVGVTKLATLLRSGGRIALGQSSLLPDMFLAWDSGLEHRINEAVRQYYLERYSLVQHQLAAVRSVVGILRHAKLRNVTATTVMIDRLSPLNAATEAYLAQVIFRDTWGERLRPYLSADDIASLVALSDPSDLRFALRRPDFHFLQTFTVAVGEI